MPLSTIEQVAIFRAVFRQPETGALCLALLREELLELEEAVVKDDKVEILDALCDLQYVLDGTFIHFGFAKVKDAAFAEVHRSNMSKLDENGKPILRDDGKILKSRNYTPPNLLQFVKQANHI